METCSWWLNWYPIRLYAPVVELYSESGYTLREDVVTATEPVLPYSWGARTGVRRCCWAWPPSAASAVCTQ